MGCVEGRAVSPVAICNDGRQICDADRFTSLPELEASSPVVRSYTLLLREKPGISPEYVIRYLKEHDMYEDEEIVTFFGDEIYMGLTKQPSIRTYLASGGLGKLFDEKNDIGPLPHILPTGSIAGKMMADPFLIRRKEDSDSEGHLFFSDILGQQVMCSRFELKSSSEGKDGKSIHWDEPVATDLGDCEERGFNYPSVVVFKGEVYACGPSKENSMALSIYICKEFPYDWQHFCIVDEKASVMHATLVVKDDRLYLFNTRRKFNEEGQHRLGLYSDGEEPATTDLYVSELKDPSEWKPHPQNPVITGAEYALNGGGFLSVKNSLFRMAMDCSLYYGRGVRAMHVCTLSPTEYEEEEDDLQMLSLVNATGKGFNSLGMHVVAAICMKDDDGEWVGVADGFEAPHGWEVNVA